MYICVRLTRHSLDAREVSCRKRLPGKSDNWPRALEMFSPYADLSTTTFFLAQVSKVDVGGGEVISKSRCPKSSDLLFPYPPWPLIWGHLDGDACDPSACIQQTSLRYIVKHRVQVSCFLAV